MDTIQKRTEDIEYSRETYLELIEQNREAVSLALSLARETESPSVMRVLGELLKSTSDITDRLVQLHISNKELLKKESEESQKMLENKSITTNNNVFIGSTEELQKLLKGISSRTSEKQIFVTTEEVVP